MWNNGQFLTIDKSNNSIVCSNIFNYTENQQLYRLLIELIFIWNEILENNLAGFRVLTHQTFFKVCLEFLLQ